MNEYRRNIEPHFYAQISEAQRAYGRANFVESFSCLEDAHVLGQESTVLHVQAHWQMLLWAIRQRNVRECLGQFLRIVGAATKTMIGLVPTGNTGGSNVSPFQSMAIRPELQRLIDLAKGR